LHIDIGSGKGGFLLDLASTRHGTAQWNYLGLEIRPGVAQLAQDRVQQRPDLQGRVEFVGCNVNVDLERLLHLYHSAAWTTSNENHLLLHRVSIQFPDPHFKASHAKRRVVTPHLLETLAQYMPPGALIVLQSDVQDVLDDMRGRFRACDRYFVDTLSDVNEYVADNVWGVPTERETSVLVRGLPVYRATLVRSDHAYVAAVATTKEESTTENPSVEE
jgi:tRNA (guanine-N7-)-methyltransferase